MKKFMSITVLLLITLAGQSAFAFFNDYNYISAAEVKEKMATNAAMSLIDIQVEDEFIQHHISGAVATHAFPVKSPSDRIKLDTSIAALKTNQNIAVIVCPRGGGGAKRAYDYLTESGISNDRVLILTKGQSAWPYPELLAQTK